MMKSSCQVWPFNNNWWWALGAICEGEYRGSVV